MGERAWRYRSNDGVPEAKLFETGADEALKNGWFDSPDKVKEKRKYTKKTQKEGED